MEFCRTVNFLSLFPLHKLGMTPCTLEGTSRLNESSHRKPHTDCSSNMGEHSRVRGGKGVSVPSLLVAAGLSWNSFEFMTSGASERPCLPESVLLSHSGVLGTKGLLDM